MTERFLVILSTMIIERLHEQEERWTNQYPYLKENLTQWSHRHFVALAELIGVSTSFIKRLFNCPGFYYPKNINKNSQRQILLFLGIENWDEVENQLIDRFTKNKL